MTGMPKVGGSGRSNLPLGEERAEASGLQPASVRSGKKRETELPTEASDASGSRSNPTRRLSGATLALHRTFTPSARPQSERTPSPSSDSDDLSVDDRNLQEKTGMTPGDAGWNEAVRGVIISHAEGKDWAELSKIPLQVNVNRMLHDDRTPLMMFAEKGDHEAVGALLAYPHRINPDKKNSKGSTALHLAAANGHASVIETLFEGHLPYINARNEKGRTPLYEAARNGNPRAVSALLRQGARTDIADSEGTSPRKRADIQGHRDVSEVFKEHDRAPANPDGTPNPRGLAGQRLLTEEFANMRDRITEEKSRPREDLLQGVFTGKISKPETRDVATVVYESEILRTLGKDELNANRNFSENLDLSQIGQHYRIDKDEGDIEGFKSSLREVRAEVPGMRRKIENVFVRGDWASVQWSGVTRDGKKIADGFDTHIVENGKIAVTMLNYSIASTWDENKARWTSNVDPAPAMGIAKGVIDIPKPEISNSAIRADYRRLEGLLNKKDRASVSQFIDGISVTDWQNAGAHPLILVAGKGTRLTSNNCCERKHLSTAKVPRERPRSWSL